MKVFVGFFLLIQCFLGYIVDADGQGLLNRSWRPPRPCCTIPPCPFDMDTKTILGSPFCSNTGICSPPSGRCAVPAHSDVPSVYDPNVYDVVPMFMGAIVNKHKKLICSATIISTTFLMSACKMCLINRWEQVPIKEHQILIGEFTEFEDPVKFKYYEIQKIIIHSNCYKGSTYNAKDDIGVLQTKDPIPFNQFQKAAQLATPNFKPKPGRNWFISTFLNKNYAVNPSECIWRVKVGQIVNSAVCNKALNNSNNHDSKYNICAAYEHPRKKGACREDFGLPLWYDGTVFGILRFKYGCGRTGSAGSYVSISTHYEWLVDVMK